MSERLDNTIREREGASKMFGGMQRASIGG
jgi:hypothetical protein